MDQGSFNANVPDGFSSAALERFQTLEELELSILHQEELGEEKLGELRARCEEWHNDAMVKFQELADAAGDDWRLGSMSVSPGAFQAEDGSGFYPNLRISGVLSRGDNERHVSLWHLGILVLNKGFPKAA